MTPQSLRVLVPTAGTIPAREMADAAVRLAKSLGADMFPVHIVTGGESETDALRGPLLIAEAARDAGVNAIPATRHGDVAAAIMESAREFQVQLIVMGISNVRFL